MSWESALALSGTLFILAIIPGPGVMAVTGCALGRGSRAALAMTLGVIAGDAVYLTLAVFGLAVMAHAMGDFFMIVRVAGAAYLVWMGIKLWRAPIDINFSNQPDISRRRLWRNGMAGFAVTLGNPKTIAFYLGLLPTFVDLTRVSLQDYAVLMAITFVVIGISVGFYAVAAGRMRRFMTVPSRLRIMNRSAGTIMVGSGAALALKS